MLCNWSTSSANAFLHTVAHRHPAIHSRQLGLCTASFRRSALFRPHFGNKAASFFTTTFTSGATALAHRPAPHGPANAVDQPPPEETQPRLFLQALTAGQISRASAQAVRLSMENRKYGDALYLINSLLESHNPESVRNKLINSKSSSPASPAPPIDFGQPVSPRLSAHVFLHGLVRAGLGKRASSYAQILQDCGIHIRPATFNSIIHSLTQTPSKPLGGLLAGAAMRGLRKKAPDGENVFKIHSSDVSDTCTRAAVKLMLHARMWGQRRQEYNYGYEQLIKHLVMHGEIIMGTLLVVLFFKSLEVQKARDASAEQAAVDANSTPLCPDGCSPFVPIQRDYSFRLSRTAVDTMNSVLREIDKAVEAPPPAEADGDDRLAPALQALANLAMLLDTGQLPTDRISTLVHSLYSCPKTDHHVWILDRSNKPVRVKAYQYFHSVLMRLIHSLTKPEPLDRPPRLDIGSYNALLFYALRHRLSPALAASILDHMCCKRKPPIQPTIVTYNTLIRAGTLTRRQDITDLALRALRERCEWSAPASEVESTVPNMAGTKGQDVLLHNPHSEAFQSSWKEALPSRPSVLWPGLLGRDAKGRSTTAMNVGHPSVSQCSAVDPPTVPAYRHQSSSLRRDRSSPAPPPGARQSRVLQRLDEEDWEVPEAFVNAPVDVPVNARTLAEYVTHVTATGKPGVIANVLFRMMPELAIVDHPTWGRTDDSRRRSPLPPRLRKRYLRRAVRHGPHVYSALLNALAKAKKTGAAERVWLLAKQAEQASWLPNFVPDVGPWCLPVHAYTSMMRCYAQEANRAISRGRREQASSDQALRQGDDKWVPLFRGVIPGWAAFVTTMQKLHLPKYSQRRRRLRSVAGLLHRCMVSAGLSLYRSLLAMAKTRKPRREWKGHFPTPDERFFIEALDLFGRQFNTAPRPGRTTPRFWRSYLRSAWHRHQREGVKGQGWTSALQEVVRDIVKAGLPVPPGFRANFIGHWDKIIDSTDSVTPARICGTYTSSAQRTRFRPHAFVTIKTRGLPLGRRRRTKLHRRLNAANK